MRKKAMLKQKTMSDYEHERSAPLVSITPEEAAETMISEGGPLSQPHGAPLPGHSQWDEAVKQLNDQFNATVAQHPLPSLLLAFGLGLFVGGLFHRE
jgi:hypothetical protein